MQRRGTSRQVSPGLAAISSASSAARRGRVRNGDELVRGMGAVPHAAKAVQGWNAQAGGEISVRASAHRRFFELPT